MCYKDSGKALKLATRQTSKLRRRVVAGRRRRALGHLVRMQPRAFGVGQDRIVRQIHQLVTRAGSQNIETALVRIRVLAWLFMNDHLVDGNEGHAFTALPGHIPLVRLHHHVRVPDTAAVVAKMR